MWEFLGIFETVFGQSEQDFETGYWKFLGLGPGSPRLGSGLVLIPGLMSLGFVEYFDITEIC